MTDHILIVRVRSKGRFTPARNALRTAIENGLDAWPADITLVSVAPVPRDRYIKRRRSPTRRDYPLLDIMEAK